MGRFASVGAVFEVSAVVGEVAVSAVWVQGVVPVGEAQPSQREVGKVAAVSLEKPQLEPRVELQIELQVGLLVEIQIELQL